MVQKLAKITLSMLVFLALVAAQPRFFPVEATAIGHDGVLTEVNDNDPAIQYSGFVSLNPAKGYIGNDTHYGFTQGSYAQYTFTGTSIAWIGSKNEDHGYAEVYLDGVLDATVDTYSTNHLPTQELYRKSGLTYGTHTIKIVVTAAKHASSSGYRQDVDAFVYGTTTIANDNAGVIYSGTDWTAASASGYYNNDKHASNVRGASAVYVFTGTSIAWVGSRNSDHGIAEVYIDGAHYASVDTYSPTPLLQQTLYQKRGLSPGTHSIEIRVSYEKNAASTNYYQEIDAFYEQNVASPSVPYDGPVGITGDLLSQGKLVTTSTSYSSQYDGSKAIDNDLSTYWAASGSDLSQWLKIDLGDGYFLSEIMTTFVADDTWKYKIEVSGWDLDDYIPIVDHTATGITGDHYTDKLLPFVGARYVKITIVGANNWAALRDFKIFGKLAASVGKTGTASSSAGAAYNADKALDNDSSTYWAALGPSFPQDLTVDLGTKSKLSSITTTFYASDTWKYKLEGSNDNVNWSMIADRTSTGITGSFSNHVINAAYRYLKITITEASNNWAAIREFTVYAIPLAEDLLGSWYFPVGDSKYAEDASLYGNKGVIFGDANWVTANEDSALFLDGTGNYAEANDSVELSGMNDLTVSAWIDLPALPAANYAVVDKEGSYRIVVDSSGNGYFAIATDSNGWGTPGTSASFTVPLSTNQPHHITGTYDHATGTVSVYVDGALEGQSSGLSGAIAASATPVRFGKTSTPTAGFADMKGAIDEVRIYQTALSGTQVLNQYNGYSGALRSTGLFTVNSPSVYQVFQRNAADTAGVNIAGTYLTTTNIATVKARAVVMLGGNGTSTSWQTIGVNTGSGIVKFQGNLTLSKGGWYRIELQFLDSMGHVIAERSVDKIGVGEVFITYGQSNAVNASQYLMDPGNDKVVATSSDLNSLTWTVAKDPLPVGLIGQGTGGSYWGVLGTKLQNYYQVPIAFIICGQGGQSVELLMPGGLVYPNLKSALLKVGVNGANSVLYDQGPSDNSAYTGITPADVYEQRLTDIIEQSRLDAGWNIKWLIALAAYSLFQDPSESGMYTINQAQLNTIANVPNVYLGAYTDDLRAGYRDGTGGHFNALGLEATAQRWFDCIISS